MPRPLPDLSAVVTAAASSAGIDRLGDVVVEALAERPGAIIVACVGRHSDRRQSGDPILDRARFLMRA